MPGAPRGGYRRITPLRNIGLRMIYRPGGHMQTSEAAPGGNTGVTWMSCQLGNEINAEKPKPFVQPEFIFISAVTVIRNPNYTTFSNPCDRFK